MLLRFAKLAGGLRLLVVEMAPLVATSTAMLSARTAAYLVGFALGSIGAGWLAIIASLVSVTGFFGFGTSSAECEAYRAQMRAVDDANRAAFQAADLAYQIYADGVLKEWTKLEQEHELKVNQPIYAQNQLNLQDYQSKLSLTPAQRACETSFSSCTTQYGSPNQCTTMRTCDRCGFLCPPKSIPPVPYPVPIPSPPSLPQFQTYPSCSSPNCPSGKKTWVQVLWASRKGNFSDAKGCFIVAYSQDAPDIPPNIEYNPFLPQAFVRSRATSYYLIQGNRFLGADTNNWKNLESVSGWDKGYWRAESTDPECRGWRPGWSQKVK